jgi:hypothetical protein
LKEQERMEIRERESTRKVGNELKRDRCEKILPDASQGKEKEIPE